MEINDVRHINKGVNYRELKRGEVYIDVENQLYVICTDEGSVVDLAMGIVYNIETVYNDSSEFIPVNAVLEIRS